MKYCSDDLVDQEWVMLLVEAKKMGIPLDEVRKFLHKENKTTELTWNVPRYHTPPKVKCSF